MKRSSWKKVAVVGLGFGAMAMVLMLAQLPLGGSTVDDWRWFGRFHVLLVHFPVGLLLVAPLLDLAGFRWPESRTAGGIVLVLGTLGGYAAVLAGVALAHADGHAGTGVERHLWGGVAMVILATGACLARFLGWHRLYWPALIGTISALGWAAHQGGNLVHGQFYLTEGLPAGLRTALGLPEAPQPEEFSKDTVFRAGIQPMLQRDCMSCHGPAKQKGDFRVDAFAWLSRGGQSGRPALLPREPARSELVRRLHLPATDRQAMPPQGQPRPRNAEVRLLEWWIAQGARPEMSLADAVEADPGFAAVFTAALTPEPVQIELPKVGDYMPQVARIAALTATLPVAVQPISKRPGDGLRVRVQDHALLDAVALRLLAPITSYVVEMDSGGSVMDAAAVAELASFRNLEKLDLSGSRLTTEATAALLALPRLKVLNLCGTDVDDQGLLKLAGIASLRAVYTEGSRVTDEGRENFRRRRPDCEVP